MRLEAAIMKIRLLALSALVLAASALAQQPKPEPLWEAFAAVYDANAPILLQGRVVRADWLEPRSVIWVEGVIKTGGTKQLWRVGTGASSLFSEDDRTSLAPGAQVVVRGYNAKDTSCSATCRMAGRDFTLRSGKKILTPTGTGLCSLDQLIHDTCTVAQRPGPPPTVN